MTVRPAPQSTAHPRCDTPLEGEARFLVVGLEAVRQRDVLVGNVLHFFYRPIPVDPHQFWHELEDGAVDVIRLCKEELLSVSDARRVEHLARRRFPYLSGIKHVSARPDEQSVPLSAFLDDGDRSNLVLESCDAVCDFPVAKYALYDICNDLVGEPIATIRPPPPAPGNACCLCGESVLCIHGLLLEFKKSKLDHEHCAQAPYQGNLCRTCAAKHAPEILRMLEAVT